MEDLPLSRTAALVPEFAVKELPWAEYSDDDVAHSMLLSLAATVDIPILYDSRAKEFSYPVNYAATRDV